MIRVIPLALAAALLAAPAAAADTTPRISSCKPTVEKWLATHGRKFTNGYVELGAFLFGELLWDSGTLAEVTVGPYFQLGAEPQICVLASRFVSGAAPAATGEQEGAL